ncbi:universal stress protein [uncultured Phascolarctobacterium sp.]|uniref:universal stress protein n=1 Tax=uncultured Phascolarctobacterium sp. TaxID=512296 RepID=UPI00260F5171|nr:universal stress protein [uncultured Phascolarctobacterium sp.]
MKEKILIAIDSSDSVGKILDYGINLAEKLDAEVTVVHAIEPYSKRSTIMNQLNAAMVKQTNELYELAGKELMEAAKKQTAAAKVPVHYETLIGNAAQQILTAAKKSGCTMIVIGSRGLNAVAEFILGSVSSKVAMYAEVPVLIVKI